MSKTNFNEVHWRSTTNQEKWVDKGILFITDSSTKTENYVTVNQEIGYQQLDEYAWGGCFNERGYRAMENLTKEERTKIIESLFGEEGLRFVTARTPIAASDFAIEHYSYDETENDYELKDFSIAQDEKYLIPYIKEALNINPNINIWASPWSPPSWVKKNKALIGGEIEDTGENFKAYALYFARYVQAYKEKGIKIKMVMPQNEPTMNTSYTSCLWSGEQLNDFIKNYLAPTLKKENVDADIWLGTFTDSNSALTDPALNDEETVSIIKGVAFQWWGKDKAAQVYQMNTGLHLMQSETMCGNGENDWQYAQDQFDLIKGYFEAGVNSYMLWNMVLDDKGENTAADPWHQCSPIVVYRATNEVVYNPQYYIVKHFSYYVQAGARRIETQAKGVDAIAFQNKDGSNILLVKNANSEKIIVTLDFNGRLTQAELEANSINTFTVAGK